MPQVIIEMEEWQRLTKEKEEIHLYKRLLYEMYRDHNDPMRAATNFNFHRGISVYVNEVTKEVEFEK